MQPSIIIPTFNRCAVLRECLESILNLDWSLPSLEVVVVDNGSTDSTQLLVEDFIAASPKASIRYVKEPVPGLLSGRHRGAIEAKGDVCLFLDDDSRVSRFWLKAMDEIFSDESVGLAGGPSSPVFEVNPPEWLAGFYREDDGVRYCGWLSLLDGGKAIRDFHPTMIWGLNYAIRRKTLFDLGGFNPDCIPKKLQRYQGDGETGLSRKIEQMGSRCIYHPDAAVQHAIPSSRVTPEYFCERAFYQGVADSYTKIRSKGEVEGKRATTRGPFQAARDTLRPLKRRLTGRPLTLVEQTRHSHQKGYSFHQSEVENDPILLEWVLKKDYFDYRLPDGWEAYR